MRIALLALALAAPVPAAARFAPATDAPYRLTVAATRDDGRSVRHFATDYAVAFARTPDGYRATIHALPDSVNDSGKGDGFARLQRAASGRPLAVRLDRAGRLLGVEEAAARWADLRAAIVAVAAEGRDAILAAHDRATPAERDRLLAADLLALCGGADAERPEGNRMTLLPASDGAALPVRETVRRTRDAVTILTEGSGGSVAALSRRRVVDRRTGLLREAGETRRTVVVHDGVTASATVTHRWQVEAMVSSYPSSIARKP